MRHFFVIVLLSLSLYQVPFAQTATIHGIIKDAKTGEFLENATVLQPPTNGTTTDLRGAYELKVNPGEVTLIISYIGTSSDTEHFTIKDGENRTLNISLGQSGVNLGTVVIGVDKIGLAIEKVPQSVEVIKPRMLETNNITNLQNAVTKLPGVTVLDGQMSIRGGSGYAYGSGSRVMLVVDEMPLMTADRGDIKWALIPIENVEQMELVKGASTVQYGSSALNGVLNVTTAYARDTPNTKLTFYYEGIGKPPVDSFQWWKRNGNFLNNPNTLGMTFLHKQKFGDVDFVIGGAANGSQSYLSGEYDYYARINGKIRYIPHKLKRLTIEVSTNVMYRKDGFQFYWVDGGHPYVGNSGVLLNERFFYMFIDPKFRYVDKKNNVHKFYTRVNRQKNEDGLTDFWIFRVDYQFRHDFGKIFRLLFGLNNEHWTVKDGTLGVHKADFGGGFVQGELNYKWFSFNIGAREEYVHLDSALTPTVPVFNAGANFQIGESNFIRASFGQAFRVPSIAERFVTYNLAGIRILPNYQIRPEKGFTAELGYKRVFNIGKNFRGYWDAAAFWTEFKDMIEFTFGTKFDSTGFYPYFQSQNVNKARIFGLETSLFGEGRIGPVDMTVSIGYTYFYGVDLNDTTDHRNDQNPGTFLKNAFEYFVFPTAKDETTWDSLTAGMLKYRNRHQIKADFDFLIYQKYHVGTSFQYYSYMERIDPVFGVFIPDIAKQREDRRNKGDFIWDLRAGYEINQNVGINFLVKNVLNANYAIRVAKPNPPRSFTVQMIVNFGGGRARGPKSQINMSGY